MAIRKLTIGKKLDWNWDSKEGYQKHTIVKYYQQHDLIPSQKCESSDLAYVNP